MPEAFLLGPLVIKATMITTFLALLLGSIFYWFLSPFKQEDKKAHLNRVVDGLIVFMITTFLGKILFHLTLFFTDPLAVLAYPSDSRAFYIASVVTFFMIYRQVKRGKVDLAPFVDSLIRYLLISQFIWLFISLIATNYYVSIFHLTFYAILLICIVLIQPEAAFYWFVPSILIVYGFGLGLLTFVISTPLFGFYVHASYYFFIGILGVLALVQSSGESRYRIF